MPTVLVIDDDRDVRVLICTMLRRGGGYQTVEAATGGDGLDMFVAGGIDAVVTDLIMPGLSGVETIKQLRALDPALPIVAVSGFGWGNAASLMEEALAAGADRTFGKPFRADDLLGALTDLLRGHGPDRQAQRGGTAS